SAKRFKRLPRNSSPSSASASSGVIMPPHPKHIASYISGQPSSTPPPGFARRRPDGARSFGCISRAPKPAAPSDRFGIEGSHWRDALERTRPALHLHRPVGAGAALGGREVGLQGGAAD